MCPRQKRYKNDGRQKMILIKFGSLKKRINLLKSGRGMRGTHRVQEGARAVHREYRKGQERNTDITGRDTGGTNRVQSTEKKH